MRSLTQKYKKSTLVGFIVIIAFLTMGASECGASAPTKQDDVQSQKLKKYEEVLDKQPAQFMDYSPTRNSIIQWAKYWEVPGRLAYTYITDGPNDQKGGYYVLEGPPVSNCVGLTAPEQKKEIDLGDYWGEAFVQAPGIDHVYGGGDCSNFYGIDAVTGLPFGFTVGMGQNMTYFPEPNMRYKAAEPLGKATIDTAKKKR